MSAAGSLGDTKGFGETKALETTVKESMSLIDRFYKGGNRARAEALDILVVVLDTVVKRMRQSYATRSAEMDAVEAETKTIEQRIARIKKLKDPLDGELADKRALAKQLKETIEHGNATIGEVDAPTEPHLARAKERRFFPDWVVKTIPTAVDRCEGLPGAARSAVLR